MTHKVPIQTINGILYTEVLCNLKDRVHHVWSEIPDDGILHHDNGPSHMSLKILLQPYYSPDLVPSDIFCFPNPERPERMQSSRGIWK